MGDIADMMLDGILCAGCGVAMEDIFDDDFEEPGFPRYCCRECEPEGHRDTPTNKPRADKTNCPTCRKRVKKAGLADHMRDKHGVTP